MTGEGRRPIKRALLSVYDKTGLVELAQALHAAGAQIVSTGSTASAVEAAGVPVTRVEELTGFPETLDGRVKTLHPKVHAGLLADLRLTSHAEQLGELGIEPFDLLVSNLYPFTQTVASGASVDECVEQIDIGGPAMVRAAAKNHPSVAVVTSVAAYPMIRQALTDGGFSLAQRKLLAARAFADIAEYDVAVADWCATTLAPSEGPGAGSAAWPEFAGLALRREHTLRYGENPHQQAALYVDADVAPGLAQAEQLGGKEMSYNNYVDADAAWRSVHDFTEPCVAIIKHANPCGIAIGADVAEAHRKAHACDPVSAFGGVVAVNAEVTLALAEQLADIFTEVIVAPAYAADAVGALREKKNLRMLVAPDWKPARVELKQVSGGVLVQTADRIDAGGDDPANWTLATGAPGHRGADARPGVRVAGHPLGQEQRDPAGHRRRDRRCRDGSGEPGRRGAAGGVAGRRRPGAGQRGRVRRVLPVRRRPRGAAGRGGERGRPARRLGPRQPVHRGGGEGRGHHVPHRHPALLPRLMDVVAGERFSGEDWALEDVERRTYSDCAFHDVDWSEARLVGCIFTGCHFGNVRFNATVFERTAILQSTLQRCSFFDASLIDCKLTGSQFTDCGLRPITVDGGDWAFVSLPRQNLTAAKLAGLKLREADLTGADLTRVDLRGADLSAARLKDTVLKGADLRGADLSGVDLKGVNLTGAKIDLGQAGLFAASYGAVVS